MKNEKIDNRHRSVTNNYLNIINFNEDTNLKVLPMVLGSNTCYLANDKNQQKDYIFALDQNENTAYHFDKKCDTVMKKDTFFSIKLYDDPNLPEVLPKLKLYVRNGKKGDFKKYSRLKEIKLKTVGEKKIRIGDNDRYKDIVFSEKIISLKDTNDWQAVFTLSDIVKDDDFNKVLEFVNAYEKKVRPSEKPKTRKDKVSLPLDILFQLVSTYPGETDEVAITDFEWRVEP